MKKRKGFTLIELVIVVAIIGILSMIMIPNAANAMGNAKEKAFRSNCDAVIKSIVCYQADNKGEYPTNATDIDQFMNGDWDSLTNSDKANAQYIWNGPGAGKPVFEAHYYADGIGSGTATVSITYPKL